MAAAAVADAEIDKPIENAAGGEWAIGPDDWSLDAEGAAKLEALRRELGDLALPPALQGVALQRFLRASKFDVAVAAARMRATKKWREENRVDSLLQRRPLRLQQLIKPLVPEEFFGFDKWGRPAYFAKVGHFRAGLLAQLVTEEQFLQYHLWGMEGACGPLRRVVCVRVRTLTSRVLAARAQSRCGAPRRSDASSARRACASPT
jgi:hypothetical protein